ARSLIGPRRLPEILALGILLRAHLHAGVRLDGAVAVDLDLAGQAHLFLAADARQHPPEREPLHARLGAEVLHPLLDQHLAGPASAVAEAVEIPGQAPVDVDPRLPGLLAQVSAGGHLDLFLLVNENDLGHRSGSFIRYLACEQTPSPLRS